MTRWPMGFTISNDMCYKLAQQQQLGPTTKNNKKYHANCKPLHGLT